MSAAPLSSTTRASRRARCLWPARLAVGVAALALGIAACGGDSEDEPGDDEQVGSVAALAQCRDWHARDDDERQQTIEDIREQINLEDGPVRTPELDDEKAYEVFENACAQPNSESYRLYIVYARAAGFASLLEE